MYGISPHPAAARRRAIREGKRRARAAASPSPPPHPLTPTSELESDDEMAAILQRLRHESSRPSKVRQPFVGSRCSHNSRTFLARSIQYFGCCSWQRERERERGRGRGRGRGCRLLASSSSPLQTPSPNLLRLRTRITGHCTDIQAATLQPISR